MIYGIGCKKECYMSSCTDCQKKDKHIHELETELADARCLINSHIVGVYRCEKCKRLTVVQGWVCDACGFDNSAHEDELIEKESM